MFASLDLIRNTQGVEIEIQEHLRLVISQDQQVHFTCMCYHYVYDTVHVISQYATNQYIHGGWGGGALHACIQHPQPLKLSTGNPHCPPSPVDNTTIQMCLHTTDI